MNAPAATTPHSTAPTGRLRGCAADRTAPPARRPARELLWGLDTIQLHDLYWAERGVCVVRRASSHEIDPDAPAYLLLEPRELALFDPPRQVRRIRRAAVWVTVRQDTGDPAPEQFETDDEGRITAIRRTYRAAGLQTAVLMTSSAETARRWRAAVDPHAGRRAILRAVGWRRWRTAEAHGWTGEAPAGDDATEARRMLVQHFRAPGEVLRDVGQVRPGVWAHRSAKIAESARLIAPLWIGAGNTIGPHEIVAGPQVLADAADVDGSLQRDEAIRRVADTLDTEVTFAPAAARESFARRLFDIGFSAAALTLAAPVMAAIALAILIDDGRPVLFAHQRQTLGGRVFDCYKFRTMRRDAEALKAMFARQNICDGPQFHIRNDPRETRVGRWLRRFHLDELPQFVNVLLGHMSVIGPRPSPEAENRYCPAWRHARLSVKSGVTGLWQVRRTREPHTDFQEWIRYDTEYVNRRSWRLDLWIMLRTVQQMFLRK